MDAISFVLGEQTRNLRVRSLKVLIIKYMYMYIKTLSPPSLSLIHTCTCTGVDTRCSYW